MMKYKITILCFVISNIIFSQEKQFSGTVIDKNSKEPIEGVLLIIDDEIISYSNDKGYFSLDLSLYSNKKIAFTHILYNTMFFKTNRGNNKNERIIELTEQITKLDEIFINNKELSKKDIINKAIKSFSEHYRKEPYWSSMNSYANYYLKDTIKGYLENDGNIFMPGNDKNVFNTPIVVPSNVRKTELDSSVINKKKSVSDRNFQFETNFFYFNWLNYRFFEQVHPLSKKGNKYFEFSIDKSVFLDNKLYYKLNYKEKKQIKLASRNLNFMRGQIWVSKEDFSIKKITSFFRFSRASNNIFSITYKRLEDKIYPHSILSSIKFINSKAIKYYRDCYKVKTTFLNVNVTPRENYTRTLDFWDEDYFITTNIYNSYNKKYWDDHSLQNLSDNKDFYLLIDKNNVDLAFEKGALQKIFKIETDFEKEKDMAELIMIMNRDLDIE